MKKTSKGSTYIGAACTKCGNKRRYRANRVCVACAVTVSKKRSRQHRENIGGIPDRAIPDRPIRAKRYPKVVTSSGEVVPVDPIYLMMAGKRRT